MHDVASPHCSYCQHFEHCFQTDLVVEWGYCNQKTIPPREELDEMKEKAASGDYRSLLTRARDLGLFVPTNTTCERFEDLYPF